MEYESIVYGLKLEHNKNIEKKKGNDKDFKGGGAML